MFFVYILEAQVSKRYYIGQTENLKERVKNIIKVETDPQKLLFPGN
jgi:predicted GIY-YIG superfamily endonuclease